MVAAFPGLTLSINANEQILARTDPEAATQPPS
jgi:hypothetical protein